MLFGGVDLDLHGRRTVLAQQILYGVHVVLPHVRKAAAVVIPIAAEGLVHAVFVVGFVGRGAEPHVVVQFGGDALRPEVLLADPVEFPGEARGARNGHFQRPAQHPAVDEFFERFDRRPQPVEGVLEAEPRVEAEDAVVALDGFDHAAALADGARHGFLAPDVLARARGFDGHDAVPVGRRGDVHDVDVGVGDQVAVVFVGLERLVEFLVSQFDGRTEMSSVDVADGHQPAAFVAGEVVFAFADAAHPDDALGELVARSHVVGTAEHTARHDGQQRRTAQQLDEVSSIDTHDMMSFKVRFCGCPSLRQNSFGPCRRDGYFPASGFTTFRGGSCATAP